LSTKLCWCIGPLLLLLPLLAAKAQSPTVMKIHSGWQFREVGKTDMFRTWRVNTRSTLKPGENTLRIVFRPPINEILPVMAKLNYQLPAPNDQGEKTSPHTRKAPYHYGWDWGPRFVTSGVWRPVSIEAWDHARVDDFQVVVKKISSDVAELTANVEIEAGTNGVATVLLENLTPADDFSRNRGTNRSAHSIQRTQRSSDADFA
jgi:beta-galactosidase/beta-glucuronidase